VRREKSPSSVLLIPHPQSPCRAVRSIAARVERSQGHLLGCELFVARKGSPACREFNFATSGERAAYAFESYRQGAPIQVQDPQIAVRSSSERLELDARVPADGSLLLGLSAVIESDEGRSYWALRHPPGEPDFHHADSFALELE